ARGVSSADYLVLNFRDPAPPSPRGLRANATPRRFPFRLITRNLSSGIWPSAFSSFSKSALNVASASTIASKDFFTAAGRSSASMFCHFNSSFAIAVVHRPLRHASLSAFRLFVPVGFPHDCPLLVALFGLFVFYLIVVVGVRRWPHKVPSLAAAGPAPRLRCRKCFAAPVVARRAQSAARAS